MRWAAGIDYDELRRIGKARIPHARAASTPSFYSFPFRLGWIIFERRSIAPMNKRISVRPLLLASGVALLLMFALSAWAWGRIPSNQRIPVHWNMEGKVDRYGGKSEGLVLIPLIALALSLVFSVLPLIEPRRANLEKSWGAYTAIWIGLLVFMGAIHAALVASAMGWIPNVPAIVSVCVGGLFALLGISLGGVRSNFFVGIRTPWTLSSELSWTRTHRLAARIFVVFGILFPVVGLLVDGGVAILALLCGMFGSMGFLIVYSYAVWRNDPDKILNRTNGKLS
jgi:uncharacterized membrane protein